MKYQKSCVIEGSMAGEERTKPDALEWKGPGEAKGWLIQLRGWSTFTGLDRKQQFVDGASIVWGLAWACCKRLSPVFSILLIDEMRIF